MIYKACKQFNPKLHLFHQLQAGNKDEDYEIVFCSMDRSQKEYEEYSAQMSWWCLPYAIETLPQLAELYHAHGLPHLVVIDIDGKVITKEGTSNLAKDPIGKRFPWRPEKIVDVMPKEYLSTNLTHLPIGDLDDKYIMLYFSEKSCGLCQDFTPWLVKAYNILKKRRPDDFEVRTKITILLARPCWIVTCPFLLCERREGGSISRFLFPHPCCVPLYYYYTTPQLLFVSGDNDQESFENTFSEMSFAAIPYEDRAAKEGLEKRLEISSYPTLIMLGPINYDEGEDRPIINSDVRSVIENGDYISDFPYYPKPYGDLCRTTDDINSHKCLVIFHEGGDDEEQEEIEDIVKQAAEEYRGDEIIKFYWAFDFEAPLAINIRQACCLGPIGEKPSMVLLDIPEDGAFYASGEEEISVDIIKFFLVNHGERQQI
jgi:nucleoredoxin